MNSASLWTAAALALAGCASTKLDAQWVDPQLGASALRGAKVLVACDAYDAVVRQICQERVAEEITARGATPVIARDLANPTPGRPLADAEVAHAAQAAGARAAFATAIALADTVPGEGVSIGIGGFGGGRHVGGGVGISVPVGVGAPRSSYSASSRVVDASGRLLWSAKATAAPRSDVGEQMGELAKAVAGAADKAGLF